MSKEENKGMMDAYQKMLNDGTAFKEVDLTMHTTPSVAMAQGIGEPVKETPIPNNSNNNMVEEPVQEDFTDYSAHDNFMQEKIDKLRAKINGGKQVTESSTPLNTKIEIAKLNKRMAKIEEALILLMSTHEQIIEGKYDR